MRQIFPSGVGGESNRAKRRLALVRLPDTQLQINANLAPDMLDEKKKKRETVCP